MEERNREAAALAALRGFRLIDGAGGFLPGVPLQCLGMRDHPSPRGFEAYQKSAIGHPDPLGKEKEPGPRETRR